MNKKIAAELRTARNRITDALEIMNREPDKADIYLHAARGIIFAMAVVLENDTPYFTPAEWQAEHGEPLRDDAATWRRKSKADTWAIGSYLKARMELAYYPGGDILIPNDPFPPNENWKEMTE